MAGATLSSHIPDWNLIAFLGDRNRSFLARLSPWTKAALLALAIGVVSVTRDPLLLAALLAGTIGLYRLSGLPVARLLSWWVFPLAFVLSLAMFVAWGEPGTPLLVIPVGPAILTLTDSGLSLMSAVLARAAIVITLTLTILMTTRFLHLQALVSRVLPYPLDQILLLAIRFLSVTMATLDAMGKAMVSRGGSFLSGAARSGRTLAGIVAMAFLRSADRAERVAMAMESRGYRGSHGITAEVPGPGRVDLAVLFFSLAAGWALIYFGMVTR